MKTIDLTSHFNDGTLAIYLSTLPDKMKEAGVRVLDRNTDHIVDLAKQLLGGGSSRKPEQAGKQHKIAGD